MSAPNKLPMTGGAAKRRPSLAETLEPGVEAGLLLGLRALVLHLAGCRVRRSVGAADRRGSLREGQRRVRRAVGELLDRPLVEVAEIVTRLVVAGVVGSAGGAAVDRRLLGRLSTP
jgi:hypothetical protein